MQITDAGDECDLCDRGLRHGVRVQACEAPVLGSPPLILSKGQAPMLGCCLC